ncbi:MAG: ABC transporter ATP-binding protein [Acidobacteriota bacterium]
MAEVLTFEKRSVGAAARAVREGRGSPVRLSRRSATPGRERWEIEGFAGRPGVLALVSELVARHEGVKEATANPVTARLLVRFDERIRSRQVAEAVRSAVRTAMKRLAAVVGAEGGSGHEPAAPVGTVAKLAAAALVVPAALLMAANASGPVLLGAAVAATAVTGVVAWRRQAAARSSPTRGVLRRLYEHARPHHRQFYLAAASSVLKKIFDLAPPILIGLAVDLVSNRGSVVLAGLGIAGAVPQLLTLAGVSIAIFVLESAFEVAYKRLWRDLAQRIQHDLRVQTYEHLQAMRLGDLLDENAGDLATVLSDNINDLETFLNEGAHDLFEMTTNVAVVALIFFFVSSKVAWVALLPIPLIVWVTLRYHRQIGPLYARIKEQAGVVSGQLVANVSGMSVIRSFTAEDNERDRIQAISQEYLERNRPAIRLYSLFEPGIRMPVLAAFSGVLVVGGLLGLAGTLTVGQYALTLYLIQRFLFPFAFLGEAVDLYQRAMASMARVFAVLDRPIDVDTGDRALAVSEVAGEVIFDRVTFAYSGRDPVLADFDLHVPAASTIAIVGTTGAGKTTLARLLLRFYSPDSGRISIDGLDIRSVRVRDLRQAIGLVSQEIFLFDGTIRDNIAYGTFDAPLDAIQNAARLAEAEEFIEQLPQRYDTLVGERGMHLSGGQRQRLCLARAIVKDPPILVLDEATAFVDNETEAAIQRSLEKISVGRTTIIIAHRLSTVRSADLIYVMGSNGRILETGRHDELIQMGGPYSSLWRVQTGNG